MELHLRALYESDARGRLMRARPPSSVPAPRFHLARTRLGNLWRLHRDLEPELARRLATLAGKEAPLRDPFAPPEREEFLRRALAEASPIEQQWCGPAFAAVGDLVRVPDPGAVVRELGPDDAARLHPSLGPSAEELARAGCIGALREGVVVAVCRCARGYGEGPTEAGVVTAPEQRGRGYGLAVVAAWCEWVRARGGEPLYSTSWQNEASRALAERLGLALLGEDRHWR
jgi:RimJ/RimL family protein N-acetyltransferase